MIIVDREWQAGRVPSCLASGEVHVWRWNLGLPAERLVELYGLLSADERQRADRFRFDRPRNAFIAGRGTLRLLVARYTGWDSRAVLFAYSAQGKPEVVAPACDIRFNLSHSGAFAVAAFCLGSELGIDIEQVNEKIDLKVADHFFSESEITGLYALPSQLRTAAFFRIWTRKEAFIKEEGQGLSLTLNQFDVSVEPDAEPALLRCAWDASVPERLTVVDLDPGAGYAAALVLPRRAWRIVCCQIDSSMDIHPV